MDRLTQIALLAKSKKVTEYKRAIKQLLEYYDDSTEASLQQITQYSKDPSSTDRYSGYSWNELFNIVHELFKIEIDRISKLSGNSGALDKERIIKLVYATTNKAKCCLKPKDVIIATIQILQIDVSHIYSQYYDIYLDVLKKYVLQERSQRIRISPNIWREFLEHCTSILQNVIAEVNYVKLLEVIDMTVQYGSSLANLLYETRQLLIVLSKILDNYELYNIKSTDILFKLTFTVCQQIAIDSRFIICKFSENIPLTFIDYKGPEEKYKLYLLFLQVHHPNGVLLNHEDSFTVDIEKWKAILSLLFKMILNDIKPIILPKSFIDLSSEVFRQQMSTNFSHFSQSQSFHDSLYIQPKKKRRISEEERLIDLVNDRDPERAWPMIQIATALYKKYPTCLKSNEFFEFFEILKKLMNQAYKKFHIMESLCELAVVLIQIEENDKTEDVKAYWDPVWDIILRYLSMSHDETIKQGFILAQNLISYEKISNPNPLLKLYATNSIQWSSFSVQTLKVFCENVLIPREWGDCDMNLYPTTTNSLKFTLLQSLLNSFMKRSMITVAVEEYSKILIGLTLKSWNKFDEVQLQSKKYNDINLDNNLYSTMSVTLEDIEKCYMSMNLKMDFYFDQCEVDKKQSKQNNSDNPYQTAVLEHLACSLIQMVEGNDVDKDLTMFITKVALIAKVVSDLKSLNMIQGSFDKYCLVTEFKTCCTRIFEQISSINWSKSIRYSLEISKSLVLLLQTKYDPLVNNIILSPINFFILKKLYDLSKLQKNEGEMDDKIAGCKINGIIVLALLCTLDIGSEISDIQIKTMSTLLKIKKYDLADKVDVICVTTILEIFANVSNGMVSEEYDELLSGFVSDLFKEWQKDDGVNCCILKLLPTILSKIILKMDYSQIHDLFLICKLYHERFAKGSFGQLTHLALVRCFNEIVQCNIFSTNGIEVLEVDVFITFLKSPYYLVRLASLKYVNSIFSSGYIDNSWKKTFFDKLNSAMYDLFLMQNKLTNDEREVELLLRSISVVQTIAVVACSRSTFERLALFSLLKIVHEKGIDEKISKTTLQLINKTNSSSTSMLEENLNYLFTCWCQYSSFNEFPYNLLDCASQKDFYSRYIRSIFPVLIREGKVDEAKNVCEAIGEPFDQVFKMCCMSIIPWTLAESEVVLKQIIDNKGPFEGVGSLSSMVKENLLQIIEQLVQRLHDLNHFYTIFSTTVDLPASDPPHYKSETLDHCFDLLLKVVINNDVQQSIFQLILMRRPSIIQRLLFQLSSNIFAGRLSQQRAKALHQYVYLCEKLVPELLADYCDALAPYFVRDLCSTLLNVAQLDDKVTAELACCYLRKALANLLPCRSEQIGHMLSRCVMILAPIVRKSNSKSPAMDVLTLLLQEHKQSLTKPIQNLGTLPSFLSTNDVSNKELNKPLREKLELFLNSSDDKSCSIENLKSLQHDLATSQSELEALLEELERQQGFAEQCATSPLHRMICRLIRLAEYGAEPELRLEAAQCLGTLGPVDLSTLVLQPQVTKSREISDKADALTRRLCELLSERVFSASVDLRKVSIDALYAILSTSWGIHLVRDLNSSKDSTDQLLCGLLRPFISTSKAASSSNASFTVNKTAFESTFDLEAGYWSVASRGPYNTWLSSTSTAVADCFQDFYSDSLVPLFKLDVQFCEAILPRLVGLLVDTYPKLATKICHCINRFFNYHFTSEINKDTPTAPQAELNKSRDAIRCMLDIVNYLRTQSNEQVNLDFDYLPIAMAAQFSSAYFSSVLYAELWCRSNLKSARDFDSLPIIDQIYEQDSRLGKIVQDILKEAYIKIGDSDSIYGCGSSHLQNRKSRIPYYTNFRKSDKLVLSHDIEMSINDSSPRGMITALRESGLYYLAKNISTVSPMEMDSNEDVCYDTFWRLSDWDQVSNSKTTPQSTKNVFSVKQNFSVQHYKALKSFHENDKSKLDKYVEQAYFCVIKDLSNTSLESCKAIYPKLCQLQMLREIKEFSSTPPTEFKSLFSNWEKKKYIYNNNFQYFEPILAQRAVVFEIQNSVKNSKIVKDTLINTQLDIARLAQTQGNLNAAARALESLLKYEDLDDDAENRLLYHEARLAWIRKDEDLARFNLRHLIKKETTKPNLLAQCLRVYGSWIAENKSENPQAIINKYYEKAISTYIRMPSLSKEDLSNGCKARAALAQFAHEQYLMITEYLKSPQFESLRECIDYSRKVVSKGGKVIDGDIAKAIKISSRQSSNDCMEVENIQKDKDMYLSLAVQHYLATLQESDEHNLLIFRLVSLWLDNMYDENVNSLLDRLLAQVPSYKFIPLVPQLAPHISNVIDSFSSKISAVLERCAKDHPHHTLPVLLALKNLHNDLKYSEKKVTIQEARVIGAQQLIEQLAATNIRPIIQEMDKLSDALVQLAYYDLEKKKAMIGNCVIPKKLSIHDIKDFQHSIVPTLPIDVKKNGNYSNIISVHKFESTFSNVGGINAPKKVICLGTDGIERPQLVKGKDDLRQDAVMQQVFTVMNSLLKSNKDAKHRKLHVRTYKVVPLTQRSGVLQWCENTLPISCILTGDGNNVGLHRKYYPNDYAPHDCRKRLMLAKTAQLRQNIFMDCCKNLHPAFHHFFTENYLSPETWFERRLAYTRSVATTSIIGYILGLGDRHVSNILIDKTTAEVIHIDFGIAFEQGKVLPTPETVPFRLTRDMEVAMGVSGVEGTMRRCCEETMSVLREQREIIVTLLRVLLYDPLYSWAITPAKAATYQSESSSKQNDSRENNSPGSIETNKLAERALLRVQQKLQGIEDGVTSSVAGQVERLIQQARDPQKLSQLFAGWQAYL